MNGMLEGWDLLLPSIPVFQYSSIPVFQNFMALFQHLVALFFTPGAMMEGWNGGRMEPIFFFPIFHYSNTPSFQHFLALLSRQARQSVRQERFHGQQDERYNQQIPPDTLLPLLVFRRPSGRGRHRRNVVSIPNRRLELLRVER